MADITSGSSFEPKNRNRGTFKVLENENDLGKKIQTLKRGTHEAYGYLQRI